ncbi:MAG TPA: PQQ-binding-like beta-propeller repeat protein [Acidimicrobiales bacterium]|nr:PQQ-binding-like beta-propeller repeat protein [Acidimicrobiales bacterium]
MRRLREVKPRRYRKPITVWASFVVIIGSSSLLVARAGDASPSSRPGAVTGDTSIWTTYGGTNTRNAIQSTDAPTAPLHVAWRSNAQRGEIYGEPLIADNRVFVATEYDTVEALSASTGRLIWSRSIGKAVPSGDLPCGDIGPTVGITSTMVIDPSNSRLFVSGETLVGSRVHHVLLAMSPSTGATLFRRDLDRAHWSADAELQRGALGLDNGNVLVGFGGNYGDCGSYHGYLMAVPESGTGSTLVYQVPTANQGAIWGPAGMSVERDGDIFVATGNGASHSRFDMSNAVIELSSTLKMKSWFAPINWESDNATDHDLGSTAPILLPHNRVFEVGKQGVAYLLNARRLGGIGHEIASQKVCNSRGASAYHSGYLYLACPDSGMIALRLRSGHLTLAWHSSAANGSPTLGGGLVWNVSGNNLLGLSPSTGRIVDTIDAPAIEHFAAPSIADHLVVVAGATQVVAYRG